MSLVSVYGVRLLQYVTWMGIKYADFSPVEFVMEGAVSIACSATAGDTRLPLVRAYLCSLIRVVKFQAV